MKFLFTTILFSIITPIVFGQYYHETRITLPDLDSKGFTMINNTYMVEDHNGGFILCVYDDYQWGTYINYNAFGEVQWVKSLTDMRIPAIKLFKVKDGFIGQHINFFYNESYNTIPYTFTKFNKDFELQYKTIIKDFNCHDIVSQNDSVLVAVGAYKQDDETIEFNRITIVKVNANTGAIIKQQSFEVETSVDFDKSPFISVINDEYYVSYKSYIYDQAPFKHFQAVIKTDSDLNLIWNKNYKAISYDGEYEQYNTHQLKQHSSGRYYSIFYATESLQPYGGLNYLICRNADFEVLWQKKYRNTSSNPVTYTEQLFFMGDRIFMIVSNRTKHWLIEIDIDGNVLNSAYQLNIAERPEYKQYSLIADETNQLIHTSYFDRLEPTTIRIGKIDNDFQQGCHYDNYHEVYSSDYNSTPITPYRHTYVNEVNLTVGPVEYVYNDLLEFTEEAIDFETTCEHCNPPIVDFDYFFDGYKILLNNKSIDYSICEWQFGDNDSSDEAFPTHTYAEAGTYNITLTCESKCGSATVSKEIDVTGVGFNECSAYNFSISPNPAKSFVQLECTILEGEVLIVEIMDLCGQVLKQANVFNGKQRLDISDLPSGAYLVRLSGDKGRMVRSLVVG
jgi:hypothetical protein